MPDLWAEIDLDALKHNYRQVISKLTPGCTLMAVVKADAYGLGAVEVAKALQEEGCEAFAVTTASEALILHEEQIRSRILVLGPTGQEDWPQIIRAGIELTVSQLWMIPALDQTAKEIGTEAKVHLKFETGLGRTGFTEKALPELVEALLRAENVQVVGAYTHLARGAQRDHSYTRLQHDRFIRYIAELERLGIVVPVKHICNSAGFLDFPEYHYDMVRIGTLLTGHFPSPAFAGKLDLRDPWLVKARIVHTQRVPKGTYVGYQSIYKTKKETTLAVIPVGYTDGFGLTPKLVPQGFIDLIKIIIKNIAGLFGIQLGRDTILLHNKAVRVAGKIGMQLTVLDVGDLECACGDEVIVPLRRGLANPRILRFYKKDGQVVRKRIIKEGFLISTTEYSKSEI